MLPVRRWGEFDTAAVGKIFCHAFRIADRQTRSMQSHQPMRGKFRPLILAVRWKNSSAGAPTASAGIINGLDYTAWNPETDDTIR